MSALTVIQVLRTALLELGLGLIAYFGATKILPAIKRKADQKLYYERWFTYSNHPLVWLFKLNKKGYEYTSDKSKVGQKVYLQKSCDMFPTWGVFYQFALEGGAILLFYVLLTFMLLTSIGWKLPFQDHLYYNLLYSTSDNAQNGAHITSFLAVMGLSIYTWIKTKDTFLGVLMGCLLVGIHEGIWILAYYLSYYQYLTIGMWTNIVKDWPIFTGMLVLFILAFEKYPFNVWKLKNFEIPIIAYALYVANWMIIPFFLGYGFLPIRTANIPSNLSTITFTQFNETKFFWNPYVNLIEVIGWVMLAVGLALVVYKTKDANKKRKELMEEKEIEARVRESIKA